jgi:Arc/MetJ-type ribon-helix-helix transcriptional regulator
MKSYQLNLRLSEKMISKVKENVQEYGFDNVQDYIKEVLRREIYGDMEFTSDEIKELNFELENAKKHGKRLSLEDLDDIYN